MSRVLAIAWMLAIRAFALIGFSYVIIGLACGFKVNFPMIMH